MFRNISNERQTPPADHRGASLAPGSQESSWIGLLSRPALVLLQRYLPARRGDSAVPGVDANWWGVGLKPSSTGEDGDLLRQFGAVMPLTPNSAPPLRHRSCGLTGPAADSALKWLDVESLQELGVENVEEMRLNVAQQTQMGYLSFVRTLLSVNMWRPVLTQEMKLAAAAGPDRLAEALCPPGGSRTLLDSFFGVDHSAQKGLLSHLSCAEWRVTTALLCPQQPVGEPKAPGAETINAFVPGVSGELVLAEITGAPLHKEEAADNGGLLTVQNSDERRCVRKYLSSSGAPAAAVGGDGTLLTPEQDNGYFSLEEEPMGHLHLVKALSQSTVGSSAIVIEEEQSAEGGGSSAAEEEEDQCVAVSSPRCHNKAIAFIMGCPCSDDSQSDGELSDDDDDDDDGFDSEGSSELSDSADEDDDEDDASDSDGEFDSDTERLWSSLCQSQDPYNPRNFTARLHTGRTPPQAIATPPSSAQSSPASSPDAAPLPSSHDLDIWDDSSSASEVDEAESLRLFNSFSSSDPYCLFSFQVPLRTQGPQAAAGTPTPIAPRRTASAPEYRKEGAEERLDSGFSESLTATRSCRPAKKVSAGRRSPVNAVSEVQTSDC